MGSKSQLGFAIAAAIAGIAWGYFRRRGQPRAPLLALVTGLEWFVAYGGAAAVLERLREGLEGEEDAGDEVPDRVTFFRQEIDEASGD